MKMDRASILSLFPKYSHRRLPLASAGVWGQPLVPEARHTQIEGLCLSRSPGYLWKGE